MLKSSLCGYSDAYILVKGNITFNNTAAGDADANNTNQKILFKNCSRFTNCISKIKNTQVDNAKDIDIVMPMYNLIEYSGIYSKISGSLWQYCKYLPAVNNNGNIVELNGANATDSFNFKAKITDMTGNNGIIKGAEIMHPLKYLSNFWRTLAILLINCEVNLILTWSAKCVIIYNDVANQNATFEIAKATLCSSSYFVPVITLSTQDTAKLLQQLKSSFKRIINLNICRNQNY